MGDTLGIFFLFFFLALVNRSHSCYPISPGRFLAVNEAKALLAHIVVTYDFKFEQGKAPRGFVINGTRVPGKANVMFRKRQK